ncbi:hypothetical protein V1514DRAFT_337455 [Lipomyces japonicus]|uniref:uncharacterized protein n=1 Tax=Lipomyces japonicus TaxID=56871 RepID=UPI0034CD6279
MGVCLSCVRREDDELFPQERQGLLNEYGQTTMTVPSDIAIGSHTARREEAMARIVAMTEENLIDIFAVGAPDRRVNGQAAVNYKEFLSKIKVSEIIDDTPVVLSSDSLKPEEITLITQLGKVSSEYVDRLYYIKPVGPLLVFLDE